MAASVFSQCSIFIPPENIRKLLVLPCFQGVYKWNSGLKWAIFLWIFRRNSHVKKVFWRVPQNAQENTCNSDFFLSWGLSLYKTKICELCKTIKNTLSCKTHAVAASVCSYNITKRLLLSTIIIMNAPDWDISSIVVRLHPHQIH